jgi:hypothetical protein
VTDIKNICIFVFSIFFQSTNPCTFHSSARGRAFSSLSASERPPAFEYYGSTISPSFGTFSSWSSKNPAIFSSGLSPLKYRGCTTVKFNIILFSYHFSYLGVYFSLCIIA